MSQDEPLASLGLYLFTLFLLGLHLTTLTNVLFWGALTFPKPKFLDVDLIHSISSILGIKNKKTNFVRS